MSDHTIIDTSTMTGKSKFTFKGLTSAQKTGIIGGGVALTAAFASAVAYVIGGTGTKGSIGPNRPADNENTIASPIEEWDSEHIDSNVSKYAQSEDENLADIQSEDTYDFSFYTEVQFASVVQDDMPFEDAFSSARSEVGAGGWFNWNGQSFSTFTEEEWDYMTTADHESFISQVIDQSEIENAQWVAAPVENPETVTEVEYLSEENTQLETSSEPIADNNQEGSVLTSESADTIHSENTLSSTEEDLSEDIIIVKPLRGADMNEDGIVDAIVFDNDGDGNIDLVALDEDFDGTFESFMINEDGDEDLDVFVIDEGRDGIDDQDSLEEISDVVNMEDFVVLSEEEMPEDLSFINDIFGDDDTTISDNDEMDLGFDDPGL